MPEILNNIATIKIRINSFNDVEKLLNDKGNKEQELFIIRGTTINQMWNSELDHLLEQYLEYKDSRQRLMDGEDVKANKKKVVSKGPLVKKILKISS